ncbi:hypothetical protein L6164_009208 [Bauhinia variegata]|uniref:Uncharacterized protein n=1 Tax=Bauhinia variegata TaxID=167791 RepID=A0ACB9PKL2_BAUVA|nr:hypothetical protein L6164_009208 [Bauhinia variegata]
MTAGFSVSSISDSGTNKTMGSSSTVLLLFFMSVQLLAFSRANEVTTLRGIDLERPVLEVPPIPLPGHLAAHGVKDNSPCERVRVSGHSRLKLGSYASSFHITLVPSTVIPERFHNRIQVCLHRNNSLQWCQCEKDEWKTVQKGMWHAVMSPYEERYIDVRFTGEVSGSVTVAVEEDFHRWRLICLALGCVLLFLAPIISSSVQFYYSSSMAVGIFLVIIILLFQGMKLLPTGRKNIFYLTVYGSVLGAGSFLLQNFSVHINSILQSFGLSEEMHNPVAVFVMVGILLAGAAFGFWIVRRFVISKDGRVDAGVAQFVKWAMRIIGATFILQSTVDTPLAIGVLLSCGVICNVPRWLRGWCKASGNRNYSLQRPGEARRTHVHAEFLSRSTPKGKLWDSPKHYFGWIDHSPSPTMQMQKKDYYSTFHKTPKRKKFTKKEWDDFTRDSTRQALAKWASSPEFTEWIMKRADRIKVLPTETSDVTMGGESDSTDDVGSGIGFKLFNLH